MRALSPDECNALVTKVCYCSDILLVLCFYFVFHLYFHCSQGYRREEPSAGPRLLCLRLVSGAACDH